jgi:hypothetical protein
MTDAKTIKIVIERKPDDPLCPRVSIGGNDDGGYYVVFRVEALPGQLVQMTPDGQPVLRPLTEINSVLRVFERCYSAIKAEAARISKPVMKCKQCNSEANNQMLTPEGPHYGKLVCASCGRFLAWLPRPVLPINPAKLPSHPIGVPLPKLQGKSPAQIAFGENCRYAVIARLKEQSSPMMAAALTIQDATFWIANCKKDVAQIRWPPEWS